MPNRSIYVDIVNETIRNGNVLRFQNASILGILDRQSVSGPMLTSSIEYPNAANTDHDMMEDVFENNKK
jgi:hypothetical protein